MTINVTWQCDRCGKTAPLPDESFPLGWALFESTHSAEGHFCPACLQRALEKPLSVSELAGSLLNLKKP